jgi:hypothetical protein
VQEARLDSDSSARSIYDAVAPRRPHGDVVSIEKLAALSKCKSEMLTAVPPSLSEQDNGISLSIEVQSALCDINPGALC